MFKIILKFIQKQEILIEFLYNFQMEMENEKNACIFSLLQATHLQSFHYTSFLFQIEVSFHKFQPNTHRLILTPNFIILTKLQHNNHSLANLYAAQICFELKFSLIYEDQNNPLTPKIGLSFYKDNFHSTVLYSQNQASLQSMRNYLSKYLNQKGFHSQFKAVRKLGKGNFASVYEVSHLQSGKKYAVKAFSKANVFSVQNGRQSLINELSVMRELSHQSQNLLSLQSVYESDNSIYMVLEVLEGKTLYEVIKQKKQGFNVSQIRQIMRGLLKGLESMHAFGIMHRDLKPQNIMFRHQSSSSHYQPVIIDYGLSTKCDKTPYLFFRCGTPGFVAPQIIKIQQNSYYSSACDMFSMGCIFHLLVSGQAIFPGSKHDEVYKKNKHLEFDVKNLIINKVNPFASDLLQRMIDSNPDTRLTASEALNSCFFVPQHKILINQINQSESQSYANSNIFVEGQSY